MENAKSLVSHLNKDLVELEDDIVSLIKWHDENHKHIAGVNWKELDKLVS